MATLAEIRMTLGASGVADAIRRALAAHDTITAAAESLATDPKSFRRAAARVGVALPESPHAPGSGRAKTTAKAVSRKKVTDGR